MNAADLIDRLAHHGKTLAVAESFTGGRVLDAFTDVPGATRVVRGGIVAYSEDSKRRLLDVSRADLDQVGAVSEAVARRMAQAVRNRFQSDYGVSTTGYAGPDGGTLNHPVGTSITAVASPAGSRVERVVYAGTRDRVKQAALDQVLEQLATVLREDGIL